MRRYRIDPLALGALVSIALTAAVVLVRPTVAPTPADTRGPLELSMRTHDDWTLAISGTRAGGRSIT